MIVSKTIQLYIGCIPFSPLNITIAAAAAFLAVNIKH